MTEDNLEEKYEDEPATTNKEDRVYRLNPQLGCSFYRPNKGENANWHAHYNMKKNERKKQIAKDRRAALELKTKQHPKREEEDFFDG